MVFCFVLVLLLLSYLMSLKIVQEGLTWNVTMLRNKLSENVACIT